LKRGHPKNDPSAFDPPIGSHEKELETLDNSDGWSGSQPHDMLMQYLSRRCREASRAGLLFVRVGLFPFSSGIRYGQNVEMPFRKSLTKKFHILKTWYFSWKSWRKLLESLQLEPNKSLETVELAHSPELASLVRIHWIVCSIPSQKKKAKSWPGRQPKTQNP